MLKLIITAENGKKVTLTKPLRLKLEASGDAPADILTAVFAVSGRTEPAASVELYDAEECVFRGLADVQTEKLSADGTLLTVTARSMASLLLDNEARPQIYCMPSMSLLMERHFRPLGFTKFIGKDIVYTGELSISKGMSEWSVLRRFCECVGGVPFVNRQGVIDITGGTGDEYYISKSRVLSLERRLERKGLISELFARTSIDGGYDMRLDGTLAKEHGVIRKRYISSIDSPSRSVLSAEKLIRRSQDSYESIVVDCEGRLLCSPGDGLSVEGAAGHYKVSELDYVLDDGGEHTIIRALKETEEKTDEIV